VRVPFSNDLEPTNNATLKRSPQNICHVDTTFHRDREDRTVRKKQSEQTKSLQMIVDVARTAVRAVVVARTAVRTVVVAHTAAPEAAAHTAAW
jgi:adenylate kinase